MFTSWQYRMGSMSVRLRIWAKTSTPTASQLITGVRRMRETRGIPQVADRVDGCAIEESANILACIYYALEIVSDLEREELDTHALQDVVQGNINKLHSNVDLC
jgi:hypothetical protein